MKQAVYSALLGFAALVAVYLPTFVATSLLLASGLFGTFSKAQAQGASVPFILIISFCLALAYMAFLARRRKQSLAAYGVKLPQTRELALALVLGVVLALVLKGLGRVLPLGAGPDLGDLQHWQVILYFWIGAPIQEETIFRGLIQTVAEHRYSKQLRLGKLTLPVSALISAALFGMVHIATINAGASVSTALFTVCGAFVLGLVAGWLRARAQSLLPGIVVHALFNIILG